MYKNELCLVIFVLFLCGCGLVRDAQVRQMSEGELSQIDDETLCRDASRRANLDADGKIPVKLMRELQKRNIEYCAFTNRNSVR